MADQVRTLDKVNAELAVARAQLSRLGDRHVLALRCARAGTWDWDIVSGKLSWDEGMFSLFRANAYEWKSDYASFQSLLMPEDADAVGRAIQYAIAHRTPYDYRFRLKSGVMIRGMGQAEYDEQGNAVRMLGVCVEDIPPAPPKISLR